jgi:hypothetical protein
MKKICILLFVFCSFNTFSQTVFPGISEAQKQQLLNTRIPVPLPTWIPEGYVVTNIIAKTGKAIKIQDKVLSITYSKKTAGSKPLEFRIEAGFDGIGDLMYEGETVKSKVGNITLCYEPYEEDGEGKKIKQYGFIQTEWFDIKNLAFCVAFGAHTENEKANRTRPKISKADAKKVLQSMQVLK